MTERRYYGLDALRGCMMLLGIAVHGATLYLVEPPATLPYPTDRNNSQLLDWLFHFIHSFRMPVFFLLAGFFAALLVEKRGVLGAYKNRAARVLAPLLVAMLTVLPLAAWFMVNFMLSARFGTHELVPDRANLRILVLELASAGAPVRQPSLVHLWFLYFLCYFYLLIPLCRWLARHLPVAKPISMLILLVLLTAGTLWPFHGGQVHEGFIFIKPHWPSLSHYAVFFIAGYLLQSQPSVLLAFAQSVPLCALLALGLFPLSLYLSQLDNLASGTFSTHLYAVLINSLCTWSLVCVFVGSAMRFFDRESSWALYLAQSSYWVYLVHMPIIALAGWWMVQYDLPGLLKFFLVTSFATVLCFGSYHYGVQRTWVGAFLNGKRFALDWPWRVAK